MLSIKIGCAFIIRVWNSIFIWNGIQKEFQFLILAFVNQNSLLSWCILYNFFPLILITKMWIFRILSDMRTLSADWMANTNKSESELQSSQHGGEESKANIFYPRAVAPTAAQVYIVSILFLPCCLIYYHWYAYKWIATYIITQRIKAIDWNMLFVLMCC